MLAAGAGPTRVKREESGVRGRGRVLISIFGRAGFRSLSLSQNTSKMQGLVERLRETFITRIGTVRGPPSPEEEEAQVSEGR